VYNGVLRAANTCSVIQKFRPLRSETPPNSPRPILGFRGPLQFTARKRVGRGREKREENQRRGGQGS